MSNAPHLKAGAFIAIEGGEGAGKSTVISALATWLRELGFAVLTTFEPGGTPEGQVLRKLLLRSEGSSWEPWAELLLMTAARVQHAERVIRPAMAQGKIVISDRFVGSTIAYQGAGRGLSIAAIETLHREAVGDLWPDLTVLLDIDPSTGLRRSQVRLGLQNADEGRFEALGLQFHDRVRACFLEQAAMKSRPHVVVDASPPAAEVTQAAVQAVQTWLQARDPTTRI